MNLSSSLIKKPKFKVCHDKNLTIEVAVMEQAYKIIYHINY